MPTTKSQKIAGGLLGLAAVAFVVDRWVIGTDEGAGAGAAPGQRAVASRPSAAARPTTPRPLPALAVSTAGATASPAAPTAAAAVAAQPTSLSSRLAALDEAMRLSREAVADAFRPSAAWIAAAEPPPAATQPVAEAAPAPAAKPAAPKVDHGAAFAQAHVLTAVMHNGSRGMAIVNGRVCRVGQRIGGFKLIDVGLTEAVFLGKGTEVTLKLPGQSPTLDPNGAGEAR
jgi:hypothetical protein